MAAQLLHDLVDDQLGVAPDVEASDTKLNGDAQAIDDCLIFGHIIGGGEMDANHVPHVYPEGAKRRLASRRRLSSSTIHRSTSFSTPGQRLLVVFEPWSTMQQNQRALGT